MTQDEVATFAGMTRGSIANIERGEQVPGLYRLLLICTALGCEIVDVLPDDAFSPVSVAETIPDPEVTTAVQNVLRRAVRQRFDEETAS